MTSLDVLNTNILPKAQAKCMLCVQRDPCRDRQRLLRRHCTLYIQVQYYFWRPPPPCGPRVLLLFGACHVQVAALFSSCHAPQT